MTSNVRLSVLFSSAVVLLCAAGIAESAPQHAMTLYDEKPKYPADFTHFDYANPDAPKGGILRQAGFGSFDSFNPFIDRKSVV